ncbi:cyclophilin-like fold protein [Pandoraea vervacti]|nr:cyclophilin-like fold protein [Pandoraea vervacti]
MNIRLAINGQRLSATLEDSAAARDFLALLPADAGLGGLRRDRKIAPVP